MNGYKVTITARVTKTIEITKEEAATEDEAIELAHEIFSVNSDGLPESYNQDTDTVTEF